MTNNSNTSTQVKSLKTKTKRRNGIAVRCCAALLEAMPMNIPVTFKLPAYSSAMSARSNAYYAEMLLNVDFSCSISRRKPGYITITKMKQGTKGLRGMASDPDSDECE